MVTLAWQYRPVSCPEQTNLEVHWLQLYVPSHDPELMYTLDSDAGMQTDQDTATNYLQCMVQCMTLCVYVCAGKASAAQMDCRSVCAQRNCGGAAVAAG